MHGGWRIWWEWWRCWWITPTARPARTDLLTGRRRPSIALWRRRIKLPRRIIVRLRVAPHIHIGVHPLLIAFFAIGGEEDTDGGFVIARVVVVQAAEGVGVLAGEAFARCHAGEAARVVAQVAVGAVGLVAAEGGAACCGTEGGDHAARWVGQHDVGGLGGQARQFADQVVVQTHDIQKPFPSPVILPLLLRFWQSDSQNEYYPKKTGSYHDCNQG